MEKGHMRKLQSRFLVISFIYLIGNYFYIVICKLNDINSDIGSVCYSLVGLVFSLFIIMYNLKDFPKKEKQLWILLSISLLMYIIGDIFLLILYIIDDHKVLEEYANFFFLLYGTIISFSFIFIAYHFIDKKQNYTLIIDSGIIGISLMSVLWGFYIYPLLIEKNISFLYSLFSAWYPITDILLLIGLFMMIQIEERLSFSFRWMGIGIIITIIADLLNIWILSKDLLASAFYIEPIWVFSFILFAYVSINKAYKKNKLFIEIEANILRISSYIYAFLPYISLGALIIIITWGHPHQKVLTVSAALCNILFIINQSHLVFENKKILKQLEKNNSNVLNQIKTLETESVRVEKNYSRTRENLILDYLTDTYNRKYLDIIEEELKQEHDGKLGELFLAIIDIDKFKNVNDQYGHSIGDVVLKQLAINMKDLIHDNGKVIRLGGDEFVIFMPNVNSGKALLIIEKLRSQIEEIEIIEKDILIHITISIGTSYSSDGDIKLKTLIANADKALYYAKYSGRNRYEVYSDDKDTTIKST